MGSSLNFYRWGHTFSGNQAPSPHEDFTIFPCTKTQWWDGSELVILRLQSWWKPKSWFCRAQNSMFPSSGTSFQHRCTWARSKERQCVFHGHFRRQVARKTFVQGEFEWRSIAEGAADHQRVGSTWCGGGQAPGRKECRKNNAFGECKLWKSLNIDMGRGLADIFRRTFGFLTTKFACHYGQSNSEMVLIYLAPFDGTLWQLHYPCFWET